MGAIGKSAAFAGVYMLLSGCNVVNEMLNDPSREEAVYLKAHDPDGKVAYTFNQTADRRNVIFTLDDQGKVVVCAEQPPDIAIAKNITDTVKLSDGTKTLGTMEVGGSWAETLALLTKRTAQLEMLRVSLFNNCLAYSNGFITREAFAEIHKSLMDAVAEQIKLPEKPAQ